MITMIRTISSSLSVIMFLGPRTKEDDHNDQNNQEFDHDL